MGLAIVVHCHTAGQGKRRNPAGLRGGTNGFNVPSRILGPIV